MNALAIFAFLLTVSRASNFNLRGTGNDTLQQQQQQEAAVNLRIFGGQPATHTQFPYQVHLRAHISDAQHWPCGGSLISPNWVLTAAHCVEDGIKVSVHLGSIEIGPLHIGAKAVVSGWGRTSDSATINSPELQYTTLRVIGNRECANHFEEGDIYDGKLCTAAHGSSACFGDSGGPLVYFHRRIEPIQIGILSFVDVDGCERGYPNAFTRVSYYLGWIREKTDLQV